ncbi:MAG: TSUP family transporter [Betaproteobacteria bacterium]
MSEIIALCGFAFLAGLVDAVAGGGGLIQVPALFALFPNLPPSMLLGTNKFSSLAGTAIATLRYSWSVQIDWRRVIPAAALAGAGALIGAKTVTLLDPTTLRPLLLLMLGIITADTLLRRQFGERGAALPVSDGSRAALFGVAAVFGFYDGFFGPGAGSLLMFVLVRWFGVDFLRAAATTKVLNVTTNFCALMLFILTGNVLYTVAIPMALLNVAGGYLGAHFAIRRGSRFIRGVFLIVVLSLLLKLVFDQLRSL